MRCVDCQHMTSGNGKEMAKLGYSACTKKKESATYRSATKDNECGLFAPAPAEEVEKRINWLEKRHG